jgi:prolyl-tRNA synthetase
MSEELGIKTKKGSDFGKWYLEVINKAQVMDTRYGVKGFQVYMPTGALAIKEIQNLLERELQSTGHDPMMFPVVIGEGNLKKEADHIKGFSDEVFWITHAGKNKLEERLFLRPTSETAICPLYSLWIRSHVDLPLKLYQAGTVYRYETKMTKPLLRGREFYWIETHNVQKTWEDGEKQVAEDMEIFKKVVTDNLGIEFLLFKRPEWDKFPGAEDTYAFETIMPDGKALQIGTTHNLGSKFAKAFDIKYTDSDKKKKYANQTCFGPGISRILGGVIGIHGDNDGIIFPPIIAPIQIAIIPIYTKETKTKVLKKASELFGKIKEIGYRTKLYDRENYTPGFKFHVWELRGVPLRIEIGPKDIEKKHFSFSRRNASDRYTSPESKLEQTIVEALDSISSELHEKARGLMKIHTSKDYRELKKELELGGFIRIPFCMEEKCANKLKADTTAEIRGTLFGSRERVSGKCAICDKPGKEMVYIARAY